MTSTDPQLSPRGEFRFEPPYVDETGWHVTRRDDVSEFIAAERNGLVTSSLDDMRVAFGQMGIAIPDPASSIFYFPWAVDGRSLIHKSMTGILRSAVGGAGAPDSGMNVSSLVDTSGLFDAATYARSVATDASLHLLDPNNLGSTERHHLPAIVENLTDRSDVLAMFEPESGKDAIYVDRLLDRSKEDSSLLGAIARSELPQLYKRGMVTGTLAAGSHTTANLVALTFGLLAATGYDVRGPEHLRDIVYEAARFAPFPASPRMTRDDVHVSGVTIPAQTPVTVHWDAASKDPAHFVDPSRFVPTRSISHFGFGRGAHFCIGDRYAMNVAIEAVRRFLKHFSYPLLSLASWQREVGFADPVIDCKVEIHPR